MEMRAQFLRELAKSGLPSGPRAADPVTETELEALPEPARRYLRFMGAIGRMRDWSFRGGFEGFFRMTPHKRFNYCEAWLYDNRVALSRVFHMRLRFHHVVPATGRDTYRRGKGRMVIRLLDLYTIADGKGAEFDATELVAYLNDAVLMAPSMLLVPEVTWTAVDGSAFGLSITDHDRSVSARVMVDRRGAPLEFSTMDRFCSDPDDPEKVLRVRWTTPVAGWELVDGRQVFTRVEARWHLPAGIFTYADFRPIPGTFAYNVAPGG